jgi:DNA replication protein DnaC
MESLSAPPITGKPPNASWNAKHLKLETARHPKLKELEAETGRFCFNAWNSPQRGQLLVFAGSNGTGKTHCAEAVRRWLALVGHGKQFVKRTNVISHLDCLFWHWPHLLDTFKNGGWDVIDDMFEATVLIIDDLGAGHDPSGVGTDKLCQVLSRREEMWTLITTNLIPAAWQEHFDRRVASRLIRNSILVDLSNVPDYHG